jgi:hypothetical protein
MNNIIMVRYSHASMYVLGTKEDLCAGDMLITDSQAGDLLIFKLDEMKRLRNITL